MPVLLYTEKNSDSGMQNGSFAIWGCRVQIWRGGGRVGGGRRIEGAV